MGPGINRNRSSRMDSASRQISSVPEICDQPFAEPLNSRDAIARIIQIRRPGRFSLWDDRAHAAWLIPPADTNTIAETIPISPRSPARWRQVFRNIGDTFPSARRSTVIGLSKTSFVSRVGRFLSDFHRKHLPQFIRVNTQEAAGPCHTFFPPQPSGPPFAHRVLQPRTSAGWKIFLDRCRIERPHRIAPISAIVSGNFINHHMPLLNVIHMSTIEKNN